MKVVIINTQDISGGAAIAAFRLANALIKQNIETTMLVQHKKTNSEIVQQTNNNFFHRQKKFFYFVYERLLFRLKEKNPEVRFDFSMANTGEDISNLEIIKQVDIIHLHWINFGFLSLKSLRKIVELGKPVVWTLHDMWAFTGGCFHAHNCNKFTHHCGNCFYLRNPHNKDLSYKVLKKKKNLFLNQALNIVSVSSWLSQKAKSSSLLKNKTHFVIPNALSSAFKPVDKNVARKKLGISNDKIILLFGSDKIDNPIKGYKYFIESLKKIQTNKNINSDNFFIYLFGTIKKNKEELLNQIPFEYKYFGYIKDQKKLINIYSASNITVVTSLYETFGQVIAESMKCKTPVVAFNNSGPTDIISHKKNGYLAEYKSSDDVAKGISWLLFNDNYEEICNNAQETTTQKYSEDIIAKQYKSLYQKIYDASK